MLSLFAGKNGFLYGAARERSTRDVYGVGSANSIRRGSGMGYAEGSGGGRRGRGDIGGEPPLLAKMTGEEYLAPLRRFQRRVLYANTKLDTTVEYPSASVRMDDPYAYVPDDDM